MLRLFTPVRLVVAGLLVAAAAVVVWLFPTNSYIFLPNDAHPVAPLVKVEGGRDPADGGGIYFVDVLVRKATVIERIWTGSREGATVVPASDVRPPGVSEAERRREELAEMRRSQDVAAAVALRELGYKVVAEPVGARIEVVAADGPSRGKLEPGDVIVAVDRKRVTAPSELRRAIRERGSGKRLNVRVRRGAKIVNVEVRTIRGPEGTPLVGVIVSQAATIKLPLDVEIDSGGVGGPSAGLAFALDVLEELGRDVDHGRRIAVTGAIELDGTVGQIGGVKQKTIGVRRSHIKVFVVPAGDNAREARRYAEGIRIVPVGTFQQALRVLATLRRTAQN
ncbi:MAG TPA: S16 family serine protease [Gaiellaceae bacterium]|nr:S16 family serine protease [Gaiellaceae bacterium]